jgi:hypothetical protein
MEFIVKLHSTVPLLICALLVATGDVNATGKAAAQQPYLSQSGAPAQDAAKDSNSVAAVSGNWQISWTDDNGDSMQALFQIQQHGTKLSGSFEAKRGSAPLTGTLQGKEVSLRVKARKRQISFTGTVDGDKMTGTTEQGKSWAATRE